MKLFLLALILICSCTAAYPQSPVRAEIKEIYFAKDDGTGNAADRAVTVFSPADIPIYCVVQLTSAVSATVKMNLVAENVQGVKADTKVVSTSYTTRNGEDRVNFYGRPAGKWTPGKYRADIFIDGKLIKNLTFEVRDTVNVSGSRSFQPRKSNKPSVPPKKNGVPFTIRTANR